MGRPRKCSTCKGFHRIYTHTEFLRDLKVLAENIRASDIFPQLSTIFGVPSGGYIPARYLASWLNLPMVLSWEDVGPRTLVVDDIADTGETILREYRALQVAVLWFDEERCRFTPQFYVRTKEDSRWIQFPWETMETTHRRMYVT